VSKKAWTLPCILQELEICGCGQSGGHLVRVLNERDVTDGGNLCPLWLVGLKSVRNSVGDTFYLHAVQLAESFSELYTLLATVP